MQTKEINPMTLPELKQRIESMPEGTIISIELIEEENDGKEEREGKHIDLLRHHPGVLAAHVAQQCRLTSVSTKGLSNSQNSKHYSSDTLGKGMRF